MAYPTKLSFNPKPSTIMHIDLNSCFATIEQQANPHLRGKPIAVAAYSTPSGCIIAPSVEAKRLGIKVGMRVKEGRLLCPNLIIHEPDPWKYRNVHMALKKIISDYTNDFFPKSIDEFVLNFEGYPAFNLGMINIARKIKDRIKNEVGDFLTVSVGISTNRFLAKTASGLNKPDGLDEINIKNYLDIYRGLELMDLNGIKTQNASRLNSVGIYSVLDFFKSDVKTLKAAFKSVGSYYWYLRLRGWEIDDVIFARRSYGNSYALPKPFYKLEDLSPILSKLVTKMTARLRKAGYKAHGVHVAVVYRDNSFWHKGISFEREMFDTADIYKEAFRILRRSPYKNPVRNLAVSCFNLVKNEDFQLELFDDIEKKRKVSRAVDTVNDRWGEFVITPARLLGAKDDVQDRIAFGNVKELEEFVNKLNLPY
jgi:DNA polymerase IV